MKTKKTITVTLTIGLFSRSKFTHAESMLTNDDITTGVYSALVDEYTFMDNLRQQIVDVCDGTDIAVENPTCKVEIA